MAMGDGARAVAQINSGIPACWTWPLPPGVDAVHPPAPKTREARELWKALQEWQAGRCAICGYPTSSMRIDHHHETGRIRGLLCNRCNTQEGLGGGPVYDGYRERNPASMFGLIRNYPRPKVQPYLVTKADSKLLGYILDNWTAGTAVDPVVVRELEAACDAAQPEPVA